MFADEDLTEFTDFVPTERAVIDQVQQFTPSTWVQACRWLIKNDDLWFQGEHTGNSNSAFLAPTKGIGVTQTKIFIG